MGEPMLARVFGQNDDPVPPEKLVEHLRSSGFNATGHFRGDDDGWFEAKLILEDSERGLEVQRYRAAEEGVRAQLNTWAAWVEDVLGEEQAAPWMQQLIATVQVIIMQLPDDESADDWSPCLSCLCRYLAAATAGFFQVDGQGFFAADGTLVVAENGISRGSHGGHG